MHSYCCSFHFAKCLGLILDTFAPILCPLISFLNQLPDFKHVVWIPFIYALYFSSSSQQTLPTSHYASLRLYLLSSTSDHARASYSLVSYKSYYSAPITGCSDFQSLDTCFFSLLLLLRFSIDAKVMLKSKGFIFQLAILYSLSDSQ